MSEGKHKKQINTAEFSKTVMQSALVHLLKSCETDGEEKQRFAHVEYGALTAFSDIVGKYIETIGMSSSENAAASGRAVTNLYDVLSAFSTTTVPPITVEALFNFAAESELSHKLDRRVEDFPAKKKRRDGAFGKMIGDRQQHDFHILPFLPQYPPRHTYIHTKADVLDREDDPKKIHEKRIEQHMALKQSIMTYGKRNLLNGKGNGVSSNHEKNSDEQNKTIENPFLTPADDGNSDNTTTTTTSSSLKRKRGNVADLL
jgi:hypothetical protein